MSQYAIEAKVPVLKSGYHWCTSYFGEIRKGLGTAPHTGVDLTGKRGAVDDIVCFEDGIVEYARNTIKGYTTTYPAGNYVVVHHSSGYKTRYLHMAYGTVAVVKGQAVKRGDLIGRMGSTGHSTGNHLHFEVQKKSVLLYSPIDPEPYLEGTAQMNPIIAPTKSGKGDVNDDGAIDAKDYLMAKRIWLGTYKPTPEQLFRAAIGDGLKVTVKDLYKIKMAVIGKYKIE